MKIRLILSSICLLLVCFSYSFIEASETEFDWSVTLYDSSNHSLVTLSNDNVSTQKLPYLENAIEILQVTDDHHYAVATLYPADDDYQAQSVVIDLITSEVIPIEHPEMGDEEFFIHYASGAFNSEMTAIALPYVSHDNASGFGCCDSGGIVTIDLATGSITHQLTDLDKTFNHPAHSTAWVTKWTSKGIWFYPKCAACTPQYSFFYKLWDPEDDILFVTDRYDDLRSGSHLARTGELLRSESRLDFPLGGMGGGEFAPYNTVTLYQSNESTWSTSGQAVYFDMDNLKFRESQWVMSGNAFLVMGNKAVLVFRDGQQLEVDMNTQDQFLAMTTDGWLMLNNQVHEVEQYRIHDKIVTKQTIYHAKGDVIIGDTFLSLDESELPYFVQDIQPPDIEFCPKALPTRLKVGNIAETLVDSHEAQIASLQIGDVDFDELEVSEAVMLDKGTQLTVLEGIACNNDGTGYVKVAYGDSIGWILEVLWDNYYLAPIGHVD